VRHLVGIVPIIDLLFLILFSELEKNRKKKNKVFASSEMETRQEEDDDALGL
jgi:FtsZ-interacting cell division protein ZipA